METWRFQYYVKGSVPPALAPGVVTVRRGDKPDGKIQVMYGKLMSPFNSGIFGLRKVV